MYISILYDVMFSSLVVTEEHNFDFCAVTVIVDRGPQVSAGGPFAASNKLYNSLQKIQRAQNFNENWLIQLRLLQLLQS